MPNLVSIRLVKVLAGKMHGVQLVQICESICIDRKLILKKSRSGSNQYIVYSRRL